MEQITLLIFVLMVGAVIGFLMFAVSAVVRLADTCKSELLRCFERLMERLLAINNRLKAVERRLRDIEKVAAVDQNSGALPPGVYEETQDESGRFKLVRIDNQPDNSSGLPGGLPHGLKPAARV